MTILICLIALILVFKSVLFVIPTQSRLRGRTERIMCIFIYLVLIFLAAFRGEFVGTDTSDYIGDYDRISLFSFSDITDAYEDYFGFYYLMKLCTLMKFPLWGFFGLIELLYLTAIGRFIAKYSSDKLYSILLFVILLFNFSLAGIKQVLAMTLTLHAYLELTEKRVVSAVLLSVGAFFVHPVSLVFVFAYLLFFCRNKRFYSVIIITILLLFVVSPIRLFTMLLMLLGNEHFEMYLDLDKSYSTKTLIFYILMILLSLPFVRQYLRKSENPGDAKVELGCLAVVCVFQYLSSISPSLFRLSLFYVPFFLSYLPNVYGTNPGMLQKWGKTLTMIGAIVFYLYANRNFVYSFSWQFENFLIF